MRANRATEPFTEEEIEQYIQKLNEMSQSLLSGMLDSFDAFYEHMTEHLEGHHEQTFKQWVDENYERAVGEAQTDVEEEAFSDRDSF